MPQQSNSGALRLVSMIILGVVLLLSAITMSCNRVTIEKPGEEIVFNKTPFFSFMFAGGVDPQALKQGSAFKAPTTSAIYVNMLPVTYDENFDDIMPKDNNPISYHAAVRIRVTDSVVMVREFGPDWYKNDLQRPFQTMNRQEVRQYSMPELALDQAKVKQAEDNLKAELTRYAGEIHRRTGNGKGLPIIVEDVSLGKISPHKDIIDAYNQTGVQQQRAKTEHQRAVAEDSRKEAESKRAIADKAYQDSLGLTTQQFIELKRIELCKSANCTVIMGNATPVVSVGK